MLEMDWRVLASLALIALILYWSFVPTKAKRKELFEQMQRKQRQAKYIEPSLRTYTQLMITGMTARRGDTSILLTNLSGMPTVNFDGIAQGVYSETVYIRLTGDGEVQQYPTETLVQNAYTKGDYGLVALTMSPGNITQRNIVPEIIHPSNAFNLEFIFRVNPK